MKEAIAVDLAGELARVTETWSPRACTVTRGTITRTKTSSFS